LDHRDTDVHPAASRLGYDERARNGPRRSVLFTLHKSIGLTIVMIAACLVTESLSGLAANAQTTTPIKVQTVVP
jgi:cytochrome b561